MGLAHAGQTNGVRLVLYNVERTGLQVLRHGSNFVKLPAVDFGEQTAELPDLLGKTKLRVEHQATHSGDQIQTLSGKLLFWDLAIWSLHIFVSFFLSVQFLAPSPR